MPYGDRFEQALVYAARLHRDQVRKQTDAPYVTHLLAVAALVGEAGGNEDEVIAALLHDAVEDQGGAATREAIRARFGDEVARIVDGCTDADTIPKPPWRKRKEDYLAHLATADHSIRLVSAADKLHNARCTLLELRRNGDAIWERFKGGKEGTLWYYRSLLEIYQRFEANPIVEELARVIAEIERLTAA